MQDRPFSSRAGAAPTSSGASAKPKPLHSIKCSVCSKVFKRSEHCARHELSHTNERPFGCQFCDRTYARKDLVKRHERTIHADLYNALANPVNPNNRKRTADADVWDSHTRPAPQVGRSPTQRPHSVLNTRDFALSDEEHPMTARSGASAGSRRATFSAGLDLDLSSATASVPRGNLIPAVLPDSAEATNNATADPVDTHQDGPLSVLDARASNFSASQHPAPGGENSVFGFDSLLAASPFGVSVSTDSQLVGFGLEQPPSKRQRQSNDSPSEQSVQNEHNFSWTVPSPNAVEGSLGLLDSSSLLDIDLMMGGVSNEFFFHQIAQQYGRNLDTNGSMGKISTITDGSVSLLPGPSGHSPLGHLSDSISDSGTEKTDRIRLPMILKEKSENAPRLLVDDFAFEALSADVKQRLASDEIDLPVKTRRELQHFLNGYLDCFHRHLPILHLPTLEMSQTPSPLILAVCCIGALYRLERQKARKIYLLAARICHSSENADVDHVTSLRPLWLMQARILLLLYAALGDDSATAEFEIGRMGTFITDYRTRRCALRAKCHQQFKPQWHEWIEIESAKRFLCAMFICSSLLVIMYDIPPGAGITQDLEIEVLEEEKLWTAATAEDWQSLRNSGSRSQSRTIRSVMGDMLAGRTNDSVDGSLYHISGFTTLVVIHGVNMYAWNLSQFCHLSASAHADLSGFTSNTLLTNTLMTLGRCREVLQLARPEGIESVWNNPEGPLLLNCEAMLRVSYTRLFLSSSMPEGITLLLNTSAEHAGLLAQFVAARQERTPLVTKVMASMFEAFSVPSKAGYLLVQKTAAINWSVEHAIAGWSCVLLLSKWLHCLDVQLDNIPLGPAELEIVSMVKTALEGMGIDYDERSSLAASVVGSWAPLMTDVWVWGITTKMGAILTELAQVYETSSQNARRHRLRD